MLSNRLTLPLLTLFVCSLQAGEVNAANQSLTKNTAETAAKITGITGAVQATQSINPPGSASRLFLHLQQAYNKFNTDCSTLVTAVSDKDFDFTKAKSDLTKLQALYGACQEKRQAIIKKDCSYFANVSEQQNTELENQNKKAKDSINGLREKLVNRLKEGQAKNLNNKIELQKLLEESKVLEDHLFYDAESKSSNAYQMLQLLKTELKNNIAELELLEAARKKAADVATEAQRLANEEAQRVKDRIAAEEAQRQAAELARQNSFWYKITRGKYALPMIAALSVAAGLTYGETKHKFISKLLWGKQPEKVIQLSWWARNWSWFKRLLRLHA